MTLNSEYVKEAHDYRKDHSYLMAGEYYSIAGHNYLAASWASIRDRDLGHLRKGGLLEAFVWQEYAATCYLLTDSRSRAENRAKQGILGLEDARSTLIDHPAWLGLAWELDGDLRTIAGLGGSDEAYETALEYLEEVESNANPGEVLSWCTEPGFNETGVYLTTLAGSVDTGLELSDLRKKDGQPSLVERTEYKRERLPTLLDKLVAQGEWRWEEQELPSIEDDIDSEDENPTGGC